tara:strand:+ start:262 stop:438 length:177 start_codon:yes stop_codon:yes gene_type:complete
MVELFEDINVLENALIALDEGASDEKRMAMSSLETMLNNKKAEVAKLEEYMEKESSGY